MGMFDYVAVKLPCLSCEKQTGGLQTKHRGCDMETVPFDDRISDLYCHCEHCGKWNRYSVDWDYRIPKITVTGDEKSISGTLMEIKNYEILKEQE